MKTIDSATSWLLDQQESLDKIIAEAAIQFHKENHFRVNYAYDLKTCNKESFRLVKGGDLCYDRYTMGMSYSTWYHGRRVNTMISAVLRVLLDFGSDRESIDIYDLGAGTGAVLWSLALSKLALEKSGHQIPKLHIRMLDASPFMLDYCKRYLMPQFYKRYSESSEITIELSVNSWINEAEEGLTSPWIFASYLFDHHENYQQVQETFQSLVEDVEPELIVLSTSTQATKSRYLNSAVTRIKDLGYSERNYKHNLIYNGVLNHTRSVRNSIQNQLDVGFFYTPTWDRDSNIFRTVVLNNLKTRELGFGQKIDKRERLSMYQAPISVRNEIVLSEEQKKAASPNGRPTIIMGPAGCGKSVIITERIKNIFEKHDYDPSLLILLTTFNKELSEQLYKWMNDLVGDKMDFKKKGQYGSNHWEGQLKGSNKVNLFIMHFDILPTRLSHKQFRNQYKTVINEKASHIILEQVIRAYIKEESLSASRYSHILSPQYILDEYVRIIYGLECYSRDEYLEIDRKGRGARLYKNGKSRQIVWDLIINFLETIKNDEIDTFQTIRYKFFKSLRKGGENENLLNKFDYVFVDEFQDCTESDYKLFYKLLKKPDNLLIAGDYAQAVHMGFSSDIPRDEEMRRNFDRREINGSYRLPMWVSHALKPLTVHINGKEKNSSIIQPYKGAPPGSRIMSVYASNTEKMAMKIIDVINTYSIYSLEEWDKYTGKKARGTVVLEMDSELSRTINHAQTSNIVAISDTILRLKGIEKKCVIWSTRKEIEDKDELYHFVYTILSRTAGLCIIALFDNMPSEFKKCVQILNRDFISCWDQETERFYHNKILANGALSVEDPIIEYD
ncbi:MAG: UvrD-helicase domain-containing protein [Balneolaceae bacterium]|nr:UvrD-helicase domain-containing protein [Balneolaceae bacterium]